MEAPVFIRADIVMHVGNQLIRYPQKRITAWGAGGLNWGPLSPMTHFGMKVPVEVHLTEPEAITLSGEAAILRETTDKDSFLGLRFFMKNDQALYLRDTIAAYGFAPPDYHRKFPRIPYSDRVQTFPIHVIATWKTKTTSRHAPEEEPMVFGVVNISPNGALLSTENQSALSLVPNQVIHLRLEPRGPFPMAIELDANIRRITDELNPSNQNFHRQLGVKFVGIDESNRILFLNLLKDILARIQEPKKTEKSPEPKKRSAP